MEPFPTQGVVGEVSSRMDVPHWTKRTLYPMKYGYTYGDSTTPLAGVFKAGGEAYSPTRLPLDGSSTFEPLPVGSSILRSINDQTGKTILVKPITAELQKKLNIPESAGGVYFPGHSHYGHSNPTTRAVYLNPEIGNTAFVLAHEAGHAVDPDVGIAAKLQVEQNPERLRTAERSAARKDPYTFLGSFMQQPMASARNEAFAQRYAVDKLKDVGEDITGAIQDDWYREYPASQIVEGLDNARDYYVYTQTGVNPIRPVEFPDASSLKDNRRSVANQYLNLALDKRYREQEEMLRQRGVRDINKILGPYADPD